MHNGIWRRVTVLTAALATLGYVGGSGAWAASTVDQSQEVTGAAYSDYAVNPTQHIAQTVTAGRAGYLDRIELRLIWQGLNQNLSSDSLLLEVRPVSESGAPSTSAVLDSAVIPATAVPKGYAADYAWVSVPLPSPAKLDEGQRYAIVLSTSRGDWGWDRSDSNVYNGGSTYGRLGYAAAWSANFVSADMMFRTYVEPAVDADSDGHDNVYDDCDDAEGSVNPGATETYNQVDDDCDGSTDEGFTAYYADSDGDTYGAGAASYATSKPNGYVANDSDCDDTQGSVNPGATETYNQVDDDCDGSTDEGFTKTSAPIIGNATKGATGRPITATARWNAPTNAGGSPITGYNIRAKKLSSSGAVIARITKSVGPSARSLVVSLPRGRYKFRVSAINSAGQSAWSSNSNIVWAR